MSEWGPPGSQLLDNSLHSPTIGCQAPPKHISVISKLTRRKRFAVLSRDELVLVKGRQREGRRDLAALLPRPLNGRQPASQLPFPKATAMCVFLASEHPHIHVASIQQCASLPWEGRPGCFWSEGQPVPSASLALPFLLSDSLTCISGLQLLLNVAVCLMTGDPVNTRSGDMSLADTRGKNL